MPEPTDEILVVWLGGTIASSRREDGQVKIPQPADAIDQLDAWYCSPVLDRLGAKSSLCPMPGGSEGLADGADVGPERWSALLSMLLQEMDAYRGFVIACGTDTLAFAASAMAFGLGPHLNKPVVFTGARVPPNDPWTDAISNLYRACLVARENCPEVVVVYGDRVLRAVRTEKRDDRGLEPFWSPNYPGLGTVVSAVDLVTGVVRKPDPAGGAPRPVEFQDGIVVIPAVPAATTALPADLRAAGVRALLIQTTGAGSVPRALLPVLDRARADDLPVVVTIAYPFDPANLWRYGPPVEAAKRGAAFTPPMTLSAAVTKLSWALAVHPNRDDVVQVMADQDLVGEVDTFPRRDGRP